MLAASAFVKASKYSIDHGRATCNQDSMLSNPAVIVLKLLNHCEMPMKVGLSAIVHIPFSVTVYKQSYVMQPHQGLAINLK